VVAAVQALAFCVFLALAAPAGAQLPGRPLPAAGPLRIVSSLPTHGSAAVAAADVLLGERLALEQAAGQAGGRQIELVARSASSSQEPASWRPELVSRNARDATLDEATVAYLGEFNSGASAISIPILNEFGIPQISPTNGYVGLTRSEGADRGEPDKYYPSGSRTYVRVAPADHHQAAAIVAALRLEHVHRVAVLDDGEVYGRGLARLVIARAQRAGIMVVRVRRAVHADDAGEVGASLRDARAQALVFGGIFENGAAALFRAVHRDHRRWLLVGGDGVADRAFTHRLDLGTRARTRMTQYVTPVSALPAAGQAFAAAFRARFGRSPGPYAPFGYEAMALALDAINRAAQAGLTREGVVSALFGTRDRDGVLGRYSIDRNGDSTLGRFGLYRASAAGSLRFDRVLDSGPGR
jgi:branched-chain amino acid transport system substrate-binding protein